ncbi:hypothetical protein EVA_01141 [gut metagenome]|uniref:Uncharacterized protein n=1 Tax=gut metagenome TaxID=749906 RepID=J9GQ88_9ZZZZ
MSNIKQIRTSLKDAKAGFGYKQMKKMVKLYSKQKVTL